MGDKPVIDMCVDGMVALVTLLTSTPKYETAIRMNGLNGATLWYVKTLEEVRDFGVTIPAHTRLVLRHVQDAKRR